MGRSALLLSFLLTCCVAAAQAPDLLKNFVFRSIGPAVTGGRVVDIESHPKAPMTIFVAGASGGLWKSVNNGTTWTPIFDNQKSISIGDVALAPSNPDIVWVGTGENNNQRSAHYGDGVYKSVNGGTSFANMGLHDSLHIGKIAIDPKNPDIVYVAAMGPLYKSGGERGLFKTIDGGKTWQLALKGENETTGFIDVAVDPRNSNVVYAASMDRLRRAWNIRDYGPGSLVYKSADAGKTWKKMAGLPTGDRIGRIGIAIYPKNPNIIYLTIDNRTPGTGIEIYRTDNAGVAWRKVNEQRTEGGSYYGQIRIDPTNPEKIYVLGTQAVRSDDGGKHFARIDRGIHVDHHALYIDPDNPQHMMLGNDGGLYFSYDGCATWDFINNLPICQFYAIGVDNDVPYNVMGGLQDNGVWRGPSRTRGSGIINENWINILGGDGFYAVPDPENPGTVYTSSQFGAVSRVDVIHSITRSIRPREPGLRSNWMSPFLVSTFNPSVVYWGGNKVFMTLDRGDHWQTISPDLTTNDEEKKKGNVPHCTITTIDESPRKAGVLWAGTDDGNVWVTQDNGTTWTQVNQNISEAPKGFWVSRVSCSPHDVATAFVSYTGFREEDFRPYLYKTTDFGKTWTTINGNLPDEQISVVRQDSVNPNLLFVGTEAGCYMSLDAGKTYLKLANGIPTTIPCQDLAVQNREGDLVVGTHGRGIFIVNVSPFRQWKDETLAEDVHLFKPGPALATNVTNSMFDPFNGNRRFVAGNPSFGSTIAYYLKSASLETVTIQILDGDGSVIREITGPKDAGINLVTWNLRGRTGLVPAGTYGVRLTVGGKSQTTSVRVEDWMR